MTKKKVAQTEEAEEQATHRQATLAECNAMQQAAIKARRAVVQRLDNVANAARVKEQAKIDAEKAK